MIILAEQTGRARFNRLFKERMDNQVPATTRRAGGPGPDMLAAIHAELYENEFGAAIYERTAEQAAIAKLNELLQGGHDVS